MSEVREQVSAPADLVQLIDKPSLAKTRALMAGADLIVPTGGKPWSRHCTAQESGPREWAWGIRFHVVDESADFEGLVEIHRRCQELRLCHQSSGGIHSSTPGHIMDLALGTQTARVMVNQNLDEGTGSPRTGLAIFLEPELRHLGRKYQAAV